VWQQNNVGVDRRITHPDHLDRLTLTADTAVVNLIPSTGRPQVMLTWIAALGAAFARGLMRTNPELDDVEAAERGMTLANTRLGSHSSAEAAALGEPAPTLDDEIEAVSVPTRAGLSGDALNTQELGRNRTITGRAQIFGEQQNNDYHTYIVVSLTRREFDDYAGRIARNVRHRALWLNSSRSLRGGHITPNTRCIFVGRWNQRSDLAELLSELIHTEVRSQSNHPGMRCLHRAKRIPISLSSPLRSSCGDSERAHSER
jgi:hypothetical protein